MNEATQVKMTTTAICKTDAEAVLWQSTPWSQALQLMPTV